jgi:hypothetical protein
MKVIFGRTKIKQGNGVLLTQIHIGSIKKNPVPRDKLSQALQKKF